MNNAIHKLEMPVNEPAMEYRAGSGEAEKLIDEIKRQSETTVEIPLIIGGREIRTGNTRDVVMPHNHRHKLGFVHMAGEDEVALAIETALKSRGAWAALPWERRASISMKAAELVSAKYRHVLNAATILGQSKNIWQAEIDAAWKQRIFSVSTHTTRRKYSANSNPRALIKPST